MRLAPLIHTRTLNCDFNADFLVRPTSFLDSDIKWARKVVLEATSAIDSLQGERWIVFDNGKYRVAGVVGFTKNICQKAGMLHDDRSNRLFADNKGRLIYAFIGVVAKCSDCFQNEKLTYEYLWKQYEYNVGEVWERTYQSTIQRNFEEVSLPTTLKQGKRKPGTIIGKTACYEANAALDTEIFEQYLLTDDNNFSFCSNLCDINSVKRNSFSAITTTNNIITRMSRTQSPQLPIQKQQPQPVKELQEDNEKKKSSAQKKNYFPILWLAILILALAMVAVVIALE